MAAVSQSGNTVSSFGDSPRDKEKGCRLVSLIPHPKGVSPCVVLKAVPGALQFYDVEHGSLVPHRSGMVVWKFTLDSKLIL